MPKDVNIAFYRKQDYERLLQIIDDPDSMPSVWEDWFVKYLNVKTGLMGKGLEVEDFIVNLDELVQYCQKKGIKNDGAARSRFVSENPGKKFI